MFLRAARVHINYTTISVQHEKSRVEKDVDLDNTRYTDYDDKIASRISNVALVVGVTKMNDSDLYPLVKCNSWHRRRKLDQNCQRDQGHH